MEFLVIEDVTLEIVAFLHIYEFKATNLDLASRDP